LLTAGGAFVGVMTTIAVDALEIRLGSVAEWAAVALAGAALAVVARRSS